MYEINFEPLYKPEIKIPETPKVKFPEIKTITVMVTPKDDTHNGLDLTKIVEQMNDYKVLQKYGVEGIMQYK